jgi:hypothetical protein
MLWSEVLDMNIVYTHVGLYEELVLNLKSMARSLVPNGNCLSYLNVPHYYICYILFYLEQFYVVKFVILL